LFNGVGKIIKSYRFHYLLTVLLNGAFPVKLVYYYNNQPNLALVSLARMIDYIPESLPKFQQV